MSTSKPPRLNFKAKGLFLRHSGFVLCGKGYAENDEKVSNLLNFLIISKEYLNVFQKDKIYNMKLTKWDEKTFKLDFEDMQSSFWMRNKNTISFENLCRLNQLLKFPYVTFEFNYHSSSNEPEVVEKLLENHFTQAKLGLCFDESGGPDTFFGNTIQSFSFASSFVEKFFSRIYQLKCKPYLLLNSLQMNLEYCNIKQLENFDQLKSILAKHLIKTVAFRSIGLFDWNIEAHFFDDFLSCPRITKFEFKMFCWHGNTTDNFETLSKILSFFPNLKRFSLSVDGLVSPKMVEGNLKDVTSSAQAVDIVLDILNETQNFQKKCLPSLEVKIIYDFDNVIEEDAETIESSMKRLEKVRMFQKFELDETERHGTHYYSFTGNWRKEHFRVYFDFKMFVGDDEEY